MKTNKTILATTYAINPYKGSEDGMGWNFVCQIARFNKVIAITRENNQPNIDKFMDENPNEIYENIQFLYFDTPYWMRFWKKGSRGAMVYYWLWQFMVVGFIKKQKIQFDIVHNMNFHNDWTPSYLWKLNKPFVWGPIGHHPLIPAQYLSSYKWTYWLKDRLTWLVKLFFWNGSFALKSTVNKADYIFCMNESVADVLDLKENKYSVMPSVATEDFGYDKKDIEDKFTLISAGRLVPLKGFDLSIQAFSDFVNQLPDTHRGNCELVIVGSGPERDYYYDLAVKNKVSANVKFIDWIDRKDLLELYKKSSAFLFPSHEGAGMVVSEAMSFGLPVICLNNSGPGEFIDENSGFAIKIQDYKSTVQDLKTAISNLYLNTSLRLKMGESARLRFENNFHWDRRGEALNLIYSKL
jgi:glycosyltransferase involved in cell wall biosynthesis